MKKQGLFWILLLAAFACKEAGPQKGQGSQNPETNTEAQAATPLSADGYREAGMEYAMAVQGTLGRTLQEKIKEEGTLGAIEFCNLNALAITDSLSRNFGVAISRITDRPRNPQNRASAEEMKFISNFRSELSGGDTPEALIVRQDDRTNFYYPIVTNNLCLQCHGSPETIDPGVYSTLEEHYPEDRALGYSAGELRGLWKVAFPKQQP